jgi:Thioesterase-like superfamily
MNQISVDRHDLAEPVFRRVGDTFVPSVYATGPWDASMQHGAAPASLIAWACEQLPVPTPMRVVRMTIDLMRPVPIAPLTIESRIIRNGRKIQLCEILLFAGETEVVRASVLKVRILPVDTEPVSAPLDLPLPDGGQDPGKTSIKNPFITGMSMRIVRGGFQSPGPGAVWFRADRPLIEGQEISQLMRAAITADFSNGIGSVLDFQAWTFINGDLSVSLTRDPIGEWILLDAETWLAPNGGGLAISRLADTAGYFGRAVQSLVVEPTDRGAQL